MTSDTDVVIIGGGPAGLGAAIAARQRGLKVVVVDGNKPPIDKACGEGLMPDSITALKQLGVVIAEDDGFPLCGIKFLDSSSSASSSFPTGLGIGVRRTILHQKMLERATDLSVNFLWGTPVVGIEADHVKLAGGINIMARWIVGADGGQSLVRRWAGLQPWGSLRSRHACRGHFAVAPWSDGVEIYWAEDSQAYVTPVSSNEVCVVIVSRQANTRLPSALSAFPELLDRLHGQDLARSERGAITTMRRLKKVYRGNVALIGDASGTVDAITGEGLSLSFQQAEALAEAMAIGDLAIYQEAHRRFARRPTFMAHLLLLLDGRTRLRRRTLAVFKKYPDLFARLISIHVGETSPAHFAVTGAMLGWRFVAA